MMFWSKNKELRDKLAAEQFKRQELLTLLGEYVFYTRTEEESNSTSAYVNYPDVIAKRIRKIKEQRERSKLEFTIREIVDTLLREKKR